MARLIHTILALSFALGGILAQASDWNRTSTPGLWSLTGVLQSAIHTIGGAPREIGTEIKDERMASHYPFVHTVDGISQINVTQQRQNGILHITAQILAKQGKEKVRLLYFEDEKFPRSIPFGEFLETSEEITNLGIVCNSHIEGDSEGAREFLFSNRVGLDERDQCYLETLSAQKRLAPNLVQRQIQNSGTQFPSASLQSLEYSISRQASDRTSFSIRFVTKERPTTTNEIFYHEFPDRPRTQVMHQFLRSKFVEEGSGFSLLCSRAVTTATATVTGGLKVFEMSNRADDLSNCSLILNTMLGTYSTRGDR